MASLSDVLSTIQNGVVALNNLTIQMKGSFLNISSQLARRLTVTKQVFTGSGTYTPTTGMVYCIIECVGGGGGGGGVSGTVAQYFAGGGGGSGGYSRMYASAVTIGASQAVTIGTGGAGGTAGASGSNGVDTSVGALCIGKAGFGGTFASAAQVPIGGAGATGGTGDVNLGGNPGGQGIYSNNTAIVTASGFGGSGVLGGGAASVYSATSVAGNQGFTNSGSGGSGASITGAGSANGGAGAAGIVIITEYVIA